MGASATMRYLAIGDSYTVGEGVPAADTWPQQLLRCLHADGIAVDGPDLVAVTGWSTDELLLALDSTPLHPPYRLLTLLIGVNNQYRGRSAENFRQELALLWQRARALCTGTGACMIAISIPDWGVTRFAAAHGHDTERIAREIDVFNAVVRDEAGRSGAHFVDVTEISRCCAARDGMLIEDGLHPSAAQYALWLPKIAALAARCLQQTAGNATRTLAHERSA